MGADSETLNRVSEWTPAPALVKPRWELAGIGKGAQHWTSPCARVTALVWFNTHGNDWRYSVDSPGEPALTTGLWARDEAYAKDRAVRVARERLAELDADAEAPPLPAPSKWHPIAADIAATVAEKNAAYGDSFARSGEVMAVLYPNGIAPGQMADALAVVRVIDKLFRIATDRDALGESPWRDIAGYALLAVERVES